jgi:hypothetical protein
LFNNIGFSKKSFNPEQCGNDRPFVFYGTLGGHLGRIIENLPMEMDRLYVLTISVPMDLSFHAYERRLQCALLDADCGLSPSPGGFWPLFLQPSCAPAPMDGLPTPGP